MFFFFDKAKRKNRSQDKLHRNPIYGSCLAPVV